MNPVHEHGEAKTTIKRGCSKTIKRTTIKRIYKVKLKTMCYDRKVISTRDTNSQLREKESNDPDSHTEQDGR
jgi:hypothetical protein